MSIQINEVFDGEPNAALILAEAGRQARAAETPEQLHEVAKAAQVAVEQLRAAEAAPVPEDLTERATYAAKTWAQYGQNRHSPFWRS